MNNRLQQFMAAENISQSQLADSIGVARASISHILAGRNKPGFDFIESMSRHYPSLSLEWLITGKGRMYKDSSRIPETVPETYDLFKKDAPEEETIEEVLQVKPINEHVNRHISRIVVFYDDNTFEEFK